MKVVDITGQRFGRLVALRQAGSKRNRAQWECSCDCGTTVFALSNHLLTGNTKSCGCLKVEKSTNARHGHARSTSFGHARKSQHSRTYRTWVALRSRSYKGNIISYDPRWESFDNFLADMGERPEGKTLDRKENAKGYSKDNCRWATPLEQSRNKTNSKLIEFLGERKTAAEWAARFRLRYETFIMRLHRGWPMERAVLPINGIERDWLFV